MSGPLHEDGFFDETVAATYDELHGGTEPHIIADTVETLADLANGGNALEFAIGTGRIALPLFRAGVPVTGIELSRAMTARLREKPLGDKIEVVHGDMCTTHIDKKFSLVFLVFNTIDNLTTQDAQVECFQNAARHLSSGGRFVVETQVPPLHRLPPGETRVTFARSDRHWGVDEFNTTTQNYTSHHLRMSEVGATRLSVPFRYVWPSELDLMARLAGLTLEHRWGGWAKQPFTPESCSHVSVWKCD